MSDKLGKVAEERWHAMWCFVKGGMDERVPQVWTPLQSAKRAKFPLTNEMSVNLAKLRRIFRHIMHWKLFCDKGVLIGAGHGSPQFHYNLWNEREEALVIKKVEVVQRTASSLDPSLTTVPQDSSSHTPKTASLSAKRPAACEESPPQGKKGKTSTEAVERPAFPEILDLTEEGVVLTASPLRSLFQRLRLTLWRGQVVDGKTTFKSNLESFHSLKPLVLERVCNEFDRAPDPLEVCGAMYKHLIKAANVGYAFLRRADRLDDENRDLQSHVPSNEVRVKELKVELVKVKKELDYDRRITITLNSEKKKLVDNALELCKKLEEKQLWAVVVSFKSSSEFENILSRVVEDFMESPEFHLALGCNAAYRVCNFVKKYKEKYPTLRSDYEEFQEGYDPSWFEDLSLDPPSSDEDEAAPDEAAPKD
ncbi:hypothetical protein LIER_25260 [Lithospermum erythrorhizon]|uniref:Uncharacterized protein n=1 Tax=Lithospermum erythrorhizon TaxID=34254 RepID=A0AAV3R9Y8_LITER